MAGEFDFERYWLGKLSACLDEVAGEQIRAEIMAGSEALSAASSREEVIVWTRSAMERLDARLDESQRRRVITGCACEYPKADLQDVRQRYEATGDVDLALGMLQDRFESFLTDTLELDGELIEEVVGRGWGLAGARVGDTIVAIKIPKSGFLVEYMNETDPERKRQYYCHCPRIRDLLKSGDSLSPTYCYCGAGYYKGIWEEILQQPVEVEVLESVLQGDEVCRIAVHLPQRR